MSFENMKSINQTGIHERACMLMYHFTSREMQQIQNVARMTGITDCILLKPCHGENKVRNILDGEIEQSEVEGLKEKAIILNHISSARMNAFIEGLKKCRIQRPLIAVVTETSINWSLNELLSNLVQERIAVRSGEFTGH